jgi:uncharacterized SAM-binding protein YcdF (DUF218 family)
MFLFKKIFSRIFFPVPLSLELIWAGLFLMWVRPQLKIGKWVLASGVIVLTLLSFHPISKILLAPLESQYSPLLIRSQVEAQALAKTEQIKWIVVLSGGARNVPNLSVASQLSKSSLLRLVEGVILYKQIPHVRLLLSGSAVEARLMHQFVLAMGVPEGNVVVKAESRDTKDQAIVVAETVGEEALVLVTDASHMPRSMALFHKQGLFPLAAPVGHSTWPGEKRAVWAFFPNSGSLQIAERAFYEYFGLAWGLLRGQL